MNLWILWKDGSYELLDDYRKRDPEEVVLNEGSQLLTIAVDVNEWTKLKTQMRTTVDELNEMVSRVKSIESFKRWLQSCCTHRMEKKITEFQYKDFWPQKEIMDSLWILCKDGTYEQCDYSQVIDPEDLESEERAKECIAYVFAHKEWEELMATYSYLKAVRNNSEIMHRLKGITRVEEWLELYSPVLHVYTYYYSAIDLDEWLRDEDVDHSDSDSVIEALYPGPPHEPEPEEDVILQTNDLVNENTFEEFIQYYSQPIEERALKMRRHYRPECKTKKLLGVWQSKRAVTRMTRML